MFKTFPKLEVPGDDGRFIDKVLQLLLPCEGGNQCSTDFEIEATDYIRGLYFKIGRALIPTFTGQEKLKDLINKPTIIARNLELGKSFEHSEPKTRSSSSTEPKAHPPSTFTA